MSILDHHEIDMELRNLYLKYSSAARRADPGETVAPGELTAEQLTALSGQDEMILTVTENGYGKRSSAYEYRITRRGGQGIISIETSERNGKVVASFAVGADDQLMLLTDAGKLIRIHVSGIRIAGRNTQGVTLFKTEDSERVVSVVRLAEDDEIVGGDDEGEVLTATGEVVKGEGEASVH
jgi:DNA gyrase subunit A